MDAINLRKLFCFVVPVVAATLVGCGPSKTINPFALRKENTQLKTAVGQYQSQIAQSKRRADDAEADNEALQNQLAQARDDSRRAAEDAKLARSQPQPRKSAYGDDPFGDDDGYTPKGGGRTGAAKTAKSSGGLPLASISGAEVIRGDGDAVRIRVTSTSLFDPGKATLKPGAHQVLDRIASSLRKQYPGQMIGIEGHTDADPIKKSNWKDNHELSVARAKAVADYLASKGGIPHDQLYVAGFGSNVPIASNSNSAGKAQNRRVEIVVQPTGSRSVANR